MLISRALRTSLLISFLCHLFCVCFISIVFLPIGYELKQHSSVNFLGSILEAPTFIQDAYAQGQFPLVQKKLVADLLNKIDISKQGRLDSRAHQSLPIERGLLEADSIIKLAGKGLLAGSFALELNATKPRQRQVIFQPPFPKYPEWVQHEGGGVPVIFKIYISPEGYVEQLVTMHSSGRPEIDAILARYIERWHFAPAFEQKGKWQTVKIDPRAFRGNE